MPLQTLSYASSLLAAAVLAPAAPVADRVASYHDHRALSGVLHRLADEHRNLSRLHQIGKSSQSRELWVLEIAHRQDSERAPRPAVYVQGELTGADPAGGEVAVSIAEDLLSRYGHDARVTSLLDTRTLFFCPRPNPDGVETLFAAAPRVQPGTAAPFDDDGDGRSDEDGPEDLDGDGVITQMRVRDESGDWRSDPEDPRRMVRRKPGEVGEWRLFPEEGIDNDGDGEVNEDGPGGTRLDRNFPAGWKLPAERAGSGPYPVSEPETRAVIEFFVAHPEIAAVVSLRDSGRRSFAPHVSRGEMAAADRNLFDRLTELYEKTIRREPKPERAGEPSPVSPGATAAPGASEPRSTREGTQTPAAAAPATDKPASEGAADEADTFLDWAYGQFGALAVSPELWSAPPPATGNQPAVKPGVGEQKQRQDPQREERPTASRQETTSIRPSSSTLHPKPSTPATGEAAWFAWNDRALEGKGFVPWHAFQHPTLGAIEIGGWRPFTRWSPPPQELPALARTQGEFLLAVAERTPLLRISAAGAQALGALGPDRAPASKGAMMTYRITVSLRNEGLAPTVLAAGESAPGYTPIYLELELAGARQRGHVPQAPGTGPPAPRVPPALPSVRGGDLQFLDGTPRVRVETLAARGEATVEWVVAAPPGTELVVHARSSRAGADRRAIRLK